MQYPLCICHALRSVEIIAQLEQIEVIYNTRSHESLNKFIGQSHCVRVKLERSHVAPDFRRPRTLCRIALDSVRRRTAGKSQMAINTRHLVA